MRKRTTQIVISIKIINYKKKRQRKIFKKKSNEIKVNLKPNKNIWMKKG